MDRPAPATARRPVGLTPDELSAVVRRAAELDAAVAHSGDLDPREVEAVLTEAGISGPAARQAVEEWRRGDLPVELGPAPVGVGTPDRLPATVVSERTIALPAERVLPALDQLLRRQCFAPGRRYAQGGEWVPRAGLFAELRRKLDVRGTLLLHEVSRLRLDVSPGPAGRSRIRLRADLGDYRSRLVRNLVFAPAVGGVAVALIGFPLPGPDELALALPAGLALAGGGYLGAGRALQRRRAAVDEALHILLDRLEGPNRHESIAPGGA